MNRRLTLLLGVLVLGFAYACNEATTAVRTPMPPSFQWQEDLPPPPPLTVTVEGDANNPQPGYPGDYTFSAGVSGGSGTYTYHWYWRGCNVNMDEEWCPDDYWASDQTGSSFTTYLGPYDTRLDVVVEVQESSGYNPASGKGYLYTPGPLEGFIGVVHGSELSCLLGDYPLHRFAVNPNTGLPEQVFYGRNPCTGAPFYYY